MKKPGIHYIELRKANMFGDQINDFDFTNEQPLMWNDVAYQGRIANFRIRKDAYEKPQYWALGNFSINALPKGSVIPLEGGGYRICVTDVYLYIHDTFNFEGWDFLGLWDTENKLFPSISPSMLALFNSDFREFRERHGYGRNFTVLSPLYKTPAFDGDCWDVK